MVGIGSKVEIFTSVGNRVVIPKVSPTQPKTIFDLASLTKALGTSLAIMKLVNEGRMDLDEDLPTMLSREVSKDKKAVTSRHLLSHCAGFPDWKPFYTELQALRPEMRKGHLRGRLLDTPLIYEPGKGTLYSDLGFMLLEWVIESIAGMPLPEFLHLHFFEPLSLQRTFFDRHDRPRVFSKGQFAATEDCPWRKTVIQGRVHDENAYALEGYSGHSGLFSTAEEVFVLLKLLLEHYHGKRTDFLKPHTVREFFERQNLANHGTWAMGWDTPSPGVSSSGRYFSAKSVGHLGFTGTSIWMDLEKDVVVIFLTNRIHPTRRNERIKAFRPRIHDVIMEELGKV